MVMVVGGHTHDGRQVACTIPCDTVYTVGRTTVCIVRGTIVYIVQVVSTIPCGRFGEPAEVAGLVKVRPRYEFASATVAWCRLHASSLPRNTRPFEFPFGQYLALDPSAAYITGHTINIDGGVGIGTC